MHLFGRLGPVCHVTVSSSAADGGCRLSSRSLLVAELSTPLLFQLTVMAGVAHPAAVTARRISSSGTHRSHATTP